MKTATLRQHPHGDPPSHRLLQGLERLIEPLSIMFTLLVTEELVQGFTLPSQILLGLLMFLLTYPGRNRLDKPMGVVVIKILAGWTVLASLVLALLWATRTLPHFSASVLMWWIVATPLVMIGGHLLFRTLAPLLRALEGPPLRIVVAGYNPQGVELLRRILGSPYENVEFLGFFDDRKSDRLNMEPAHPLLGKFCDLAAYVERENVDTIYLALPMAAQPRILSLLDGLRDTTVSIYFVPDMFMTDLIQARVGTVGGMPVVSVCETPFRGWNGFVKRCSDILLASALLLLVSPLMLLIAVAVKLTSPGPVIFRQRRNGLDGEEICIYKFRSMTVCEDGRTVRQAQRNDKRLTPIGGFLRRTSLDELPQLINVLQGRMSMVGPRPHAVAHNDMYRKAIKGYMIRHKVRPGITGWAQVNGYRGETDVLDKMQKRVTYDLEYLRCWSLRLDVYIIFKTIWVLLRRQEGAY